MQERSWGFFSHALYFASPSGLQTAGEEKGKPVFGVLIMTDYEVEDTFLRSLTE
jgi:hypothetical protein